ncbi:3-methyl-2-oxobutanoate hydroxymethyltransferase [Candidatus Formimonas warabiya]|uniref:3-methyl-2-oxobutanoate hydroxymethyltransferase n=2 Tax=Formimonas warabiya TaxID=1761012 RepID=A0A3G1L297_FORW1|nr:3-methyl-2-oxobutanoate hydroxymethyltransferase [Candidatus Formimonas warabiya]
MAMGSPITMMTAYDYPMAQLEDEAGIEIILVGDSLYMTVLGHGSTLPAKMDTMIEHAEAVRRGAPRAFVIGDMPYMSYQVSPQEAIYNAGRYMKEAGVDGVKLEGGRDVADIVKALTKATIPVMGHLGLTPQSVSQLGGFKAQGRTLDSAERVIEDARMLEESGAFAILLECIPAEVGQIISKRSKIPIISIGAGPYCHGQLMIVQDMLGLFSTVPKFVKRYGNLRDTIAEAFRKYKEDVETKTYPDLNTHCYKMDHQAYEDLVRKYAE